MWPFYWLFRNFPEFLETFQTVLKQSRPSETLPDCRKLFRLSQNLPDCLKTFQIIGAIWRYAQKLSGGPKTFWWAMLTRWPGFDVSDWSRYSCQSNCFFQVFSHLADRNFIIRKVTQALVTVTSFSICIQTIWWWLNGLLFFMWFKEPSPQYFARNFAWTGILAAVSFSRVLEWCKKKPISWTMMIETNLVKD